MITFSKSISPIAVKVFATRTESEKLCMLAGVRWVCGGLSTAHSRWRPGCRKIDIKHRVTGLDLERPARKCTAACLRVCAATYTT